MTDNRQPVLDGDQCVAMVLWIIWLASRVNRVLAWHGVVQFGTSVAMWCHMRWFGNNGTTLPLFWLTTTALTMMTLTEAESMFVLYYKRRICGVAINQCFYSRSVSLFDQSPRECWSYPISEINQIIPVVLELHEQVNLCRMHSWSLQTIGCTVDLYKQ